MTDFSSGEARPPGRRLLRVEDYVEGVLARDRAALGRAITLIESTRAADQEDAERVLVSLLPFTGNARRIGISGMPGAGKSTLIDALGTIVIEAGHRVAVLAIDPSSSLGNGSILGDRTRMSRLSAHPNAFVRPSPTGGSLGGVARKTREAMLVCEAAGYDVVFVETVGVGQTEAVVAEMVDHFVLLALAGAGDELQGIKRGVLELVDSLAITKADGDNRLRAEQAREIHVNTLKLFRRNGPAPQVLCTSVPENRGIREIWSLAEQHREQLSGSGLLATKRKEQTVAWFHQLLQEELLSAFHAHPEVEKRLADGLESVRAGRVTPQRAVRELLRAFGVNPSRILQKI